MFTFMHLSRHGIAEASFALLVWLNENVRYAAPPFHAPHKAYYSPLQRGGEKPL